MIKAFKTKIYPTKKQRIYFNKCFGIRRFAWNWGLENWENYKSWTRLDRAWNHDENLKLNKPYLYQVNSMIKNMAFKELNKAWDKYYKKEANKPKFKSKKKDIKRFSMFEKTRNQKTKTIMFINKRINLNATRKLGRFNIKCAENLNFLNDKNIRICEFTISEKNNSYYISIIYERTNCEFIEKEKLLNKVGIDVGVKTVMTGYNGINFYEIKLPQKIIKLEKHINYLNNKLSKKVYNSIRYKKLNLKINKLYEKIKNIKNDLYNKEVFYLSTIYKQINYESFTFKIIDNNKVNKSLYRTSPNLLLNKLINKCKEFNTILNIIKNEPTTQTCSRCGNRYYKEKKLTLFDRIYKCNNCGLEIGRDKNSAINVYNIV